MKTRSLLLNLVFLLAVFPAGAQGTPEEITADYGPPAEANVWEKFTIPLTAETFGVDETTFAAALSNVTSFWIRTEMHTGSDVGGIDDVYIGTTHWSNFNGSSEGWSSGGDGTMEWMNEGGIEGGFLQISDWTIGDWHWLIAPSSWAGDWSSMIGQNIEFWYKTNQPSYAAIVKITTIPVDRLVINTPVSPTILPDDSLLIELEVLPPPQEDLTISFSTSNSSCIQVPPSATFLANHSTAYFYFKAAPGATIGCESVIEATCPGYLTSRITLIVLDNYGIGETDLEEAIAVYPNPCRDKFILHNSSSENISRLAVYNLTGKLIRNMEETDLSNREIDVGGYFPGIYLLRIFAGKQMITSKLIIR
jgi:hypothetical protein